MLKFSIIVPVFNRPQEIAELLEGLQKQTFRDFEVIVVEDGSTVDCRAEVAKFQDERFRYFAKENGGPSSARNFGVKRSSGEFVIFLDSDCLVEENYLQEIKNELLENPCDAFGGADRAHESFSPTQKAINYSMTSLFTTGGIRSGKNAMETFHPRSFNMGISREKFDFLGGFNEQMRFGEDIDLSIRIFENRLSCRAFPKAWVFHKRRTDFKKFFRQVHNSGKARIDLFLRHPKSLKLVHFLPSAFTIFVSAAVVLVFFEEEFLFLPSIYALLIFIDSALKNESLQIGALSVLAAFTQLFGYGSGFLISFFKRIILNKK